MTQLDQFLAIALYPRRVTLFFAGATGLPDPRKLLKGSGKHVRHIVLSAATDLDKPEVEALITAALERSPIDATARGRMIIKSISEKQRARRPRA